MQGKTLFRHTLFIGVLSVSLLFVFSARASLEGLHVGMKAPEFTLRDLDGGEHPHTEFFDEGMTAVVFWSTWSLKSDKALKQFEDLYDTYSKRGLRVLAVNVEQQTIGEAEMEKIRKRVAELDLRFPVFIDPGLRMFEDYGVIAVPTTVVMDAQRVILYELSGYPLVGSATMIAYLKDLLEGREPGEKKAVAVGHKPSKKSIRYLNMGRKSKARRSMAMMAESWFRKAIEADPKFVQPYVELARVKLEQGDLAASEAILLEALSHSPDSPLALCELGRIKIEAGSAEEAVSPELWALEADAFYTPAHYMLAYAYSVGGETELASRHFSEALAINPFHPGTFVYRGRMKEDAGDKAGAASDFRKALELLIQRKR